MQSLNRLRPVVAIAICAVLSSCGAGLITGIAASDGNRTPAARPPELSVSALFPLVPAPNTTRTLVVTNAQIPAASPLAVRIVANGVTVDQPGPVASGQGGATLISFTLDTAAIVASVADATAADLPGQISVLVDGRPIAGAAPILLVRQPSARLVLDAGAEQRFASPLGERVSVRVEGLRGTTTDDLQLLVVTRAPENTTLGGPTMITRVAADLRFEAPIDGAPVLSGLLPANTWPQQVELVVRDTIAGSSTVVDNLYYRPEVTLALPGQGSTTGGNLLTLIGTALVPFDLGGGAGALPLRFDQVEISFAKGGRSVPLAAADFRTADSDSDRLVFTMPAAPDGRPGQVDIILRVHLGAVVAEVTASQKFLYANPDPFFGPRGAVLDRLPLAVAPIALDQAPSTAAAPDFVALTEQGGVAFLQLLLAQQNGMFQRFAAPRQIADHEAPDERGPRDLCVGDFDGDQVPDVLVANAGAANAVHHVVLGQARPLPPLGAVTRLTAAPGTAICRSGFFDGDTLADVLLVPGADAPIGQRPEVLLARPLAVGQPAFAAPIELDVRAFRYEAVEVADLDGDGLLDIALASGSEGKLDVAYGLGGGQFSIGVPTDFVVPGYSPDPAAPAVGLHACADGGLQSLAIVLSGLESSFPSGPTQPTITVLRQDAARSFGPLLASATVQLPIEPIGRSLAADLDQMPPIELVIAMRDEPAFVSLALFQLGVEHFEQVQTGIEFGAESPRQIKALAFGRALPPTPFSGEARAVFIVHETEVDGERERRLSTRLIITLDATPPAPLLLPPDAGAQLEFPIEAVVSGNFHPISIAGAGAVRDLAVAHQAVPLAPDDEVMLIANDGFGGFPAPSSRLLAPGILPTTLRVLPTAGGVDRLVYLGRDSRLYCWQHDFGDPDAVPPVPAPPVQTPTSATSPLRDLLADPQLATLDLTTRSRLDIADVDGDGIDDLVALLSFDLANPGEGQAMLMLLRGKVAPAAGEFPFVMPTAATAVHGNATAFALGDFVDNGGAVPRRLELALAVPVGSTPGAVDGDHVRFFRYLASAGAFAASAAPGGPQVLLAGSRPTRLAAGDFDRDQRTDLLVACAGDSTLRWFRNTSAAAGTNTEVEVADFVEDLASPRPLAAGAPTALRLVDINGDASVDVVAFVEDLVGGDRSTTVAKYLSSSSGGFDGPLFASPKRIGDRDASVCGDLGDWNRDGVPDLFLGWNSAGSGDINLRVLFGGTR
ncbi:MAG: hypothetical protein JNN13_02370 [Planctomycetes bacterium]|nr:hypothetical protein [Planctomycetota bacterium]